MPAAISTAPDWTRADWNSEFRSFRSIVENAYAINGIDGEPAGWRRFVDTEIRGFRAPYLSTGKGLYEALADAGYSYDASAVSRGPARPEARRRRARALRCRRYRSVRRAGG